MYIHIVLSRARRNLAEEPPRGHINIAMGQRWDVPRALHYIVYDYLLHALLYYHIVILLVIIVLYHSYMIILLY